MSTNGSVKKVAGNKDAVEVVRFRSLFAKLNDSIEGEPNRLSELAHGDEAIKQLCNQLSWAAHFLKMNERRHRELFTAPVDPKFLTEWRDFENRFESVLLDILFADFFQGLDNVEGLEPVGSTRLSKADLQWESADDMAREQASAIEVAIDFANDQASQDHRDFGEGFREGIQDGMVAWERLKREIGFDLRGIFRRRELVPFILVPRHISDGYGSAETISLFKSLQQAHDAFIHGVPFAAIGLMRSIMEATLRDHYGIQGKNLDERIKNADQVLPPGSSAPALHRLRHLANAVLHLREGGQVVPGIEQLEREIVSLLYVLRALIEGAPQSRS
jgi:hypothetical protein